MADGGGGEVARRSRPPARVRERPPKEPTTGDVAEVEAPPPLPSTDEVRTVRVATQRRSLPGVFLMAPGDETSLPSTSMAASSRTCWWCRVRRVRRQSGVVRRMRDCLPFSAISRYFGGQVHDAKGKTRLRALINGSNRSNEYE
ncbi:hypothetical protein GUJ93_ZPchr0076g18689 [Zizania palustris]|uniref:Uncharacterized protein n=1 Tax=Zizania palustris TaxID=103762 RepID=A0A8J5VER5_ZIZPA|nr:hypothetical protein GUJ93_ZPchr0076g18689 [Zizania palustris]